MPRASKSSTRRHTGAAPLPTRSFAVNGATENVLPGSNREATIGSSAPTRKSKAKRPTVFYGAVTAGAAAHPYSRSQLRRVKRKAKENAALGGGLGTVAAALAEAAGDDGESASSSTGTNAKKTKREVLEDAVRRREEDRRARAEAGKIGEGSGHGMREKARRKQISANAQRIPAVMAHPAFKANPWATIREHATNSLATADDVQNIVERKNRATAQRELEKVRIPASMQGMEGIE